MAGLLAQLASFICLAAAGCTALSVDKFIPFGNASEDTIFFSNDDNTTSISVPVRFPFYDRLFTTIHVSRNDCIYLCIIIVTLCSASCSSIVCVATEKHHVVQYHNLLFLLTSVNPHILTIMATIIV